MPNSVWLVLKWVFLAAMTSYGCDYDTTTATPHVVNNIHPVIWRTAKLCLVGALISFWLPKYIPVCVALTQLLTPT